MQLRRRRRPREHAPRDCGAPPRSGARDFPPPSSKDPSKVTAEEPLKSSAWASSNTGWVGALDETALPAYQFINWIKYHRYENGQFVLDWTDNFDSFDSSRWAKANWTFDGNLADFDPANAVVQDGTLILAITKDRATGFSGTVPADDGSTGPGVDGGVDSSTPGSDSGCAVGGSQPRGTGGLGVALIALCLAAGSRRWRRGISAERSP
jgi:endo-1,3-1,4-beta-glycanase ExoK